MSIHVEVVTPERIVYSGDVEMVTLPGGAGQMGVLKGHAPLLSTLDVGEIVMHEGSAQSFIAVSGGVVEVRPDKVTILADVAEGAEDIDEDRAKAALERAQQLLAENPADEHKPPLLAAMRRSNLRLRVARKRRSSRRQGPQFEGDSSP